ncbi:MAG: right-handed parallel beta-helix repeat-containing protein [Planctomycetales bacterium]|nr:right-handed parallel beta-helix repeat-containing protein [Planctomycetales bacterium]
MPFRLANLKLRRTSNAADRLRARSSRLAPAEVLESRRLLAVLAELDLNATEIEVTNTNDVGAGSLRQAILDANAIEGADRIVFRIPASDPGFVDLVGDGSAGAYLIRPVSPLPAIADATGGTILDGRSQTELIGDSNPLGPEIILDGSRFDGLVDGLVIESDANQVFGLAIVGFGGYGVVLHGEQNLVAGNTIGLDADGEEFFPNGSGGVFIDADANMIGGISAAEANVISGNGGPGVFIQESANNQIVGNIIGLTDDGELPRGNQGPGISIHRGSANDVGGSETGYANLISANAGPGVLVSGDAGQFRGNAIRGNVIYSNQGLGIDLSSTPLQADARTPNDLGDLDLGPNRLQNFPTLSRFDADTTTRLVGEISGPPVTTFLVDFYVADSPSSTLVAGRRYLGFVTVTTDENGNGPFVTSLPVATAKNEAITATATDMAGNTSEFSPPRSADNINVPPTATDNQYATNEDTAVSGNLITDDTGQLADSDPNAGDPLTIVTIDGAEVIGPVVTLASGATLHIDADGSFTYDPTGSAQWAALAQGESAAEVFVYRLSDGRGGEDEATVRIDLMGVNDAPRPTQPQDVDAPVDSVVTEINLADLFHDPDDPSASLEYSVVVDDPLEVVDRFTFEGEHLRLRFKPGESGTIQVQAMATDTSGESTSTTFPVKSDGSSPWINSGTAEPVELDDGIGLRFEMRLSEEIPVLAESGVVSSEHFTFKLDDDADQPGLPALTSLQYHSAGESTDARIIVEAFPAGGLDNGEYELVFDPANLTDSAGNPFVGGPTKLRFRLDASPPQAVSVRAEAAIAGSLPNLVVVELTDHDLVVAQAENRNNYRLERIDANGHPSASLVLEVPSYDAHADRIVLRGFEPLRPGNYRLTVFTQADPQAIGSDGIASLSGVPFDGDVDGEPGGPLIAEFTVDIPVEEANANDAIFQGNLASLDEFLTDLIDTRTETQQSLFAMELAERLLQVVAQSAANLLGDSSAELIDDVNARLADLFLQQWRAVYENRDVSSGEFMIVWSNEARFLVHNPAGSALRNESPDRAGVDAAGIVIEEIDGAVLLQTDSGQALALVPVDVAGNLLGESQYLKSADGLDTSPDLVFHLDVEGLAATNQVGVVYFNALGEARTVALPDNPTESVEMPVDMSQHLSGADVVQETANAYFVERLREVLGLDAEPVFALWLDPVDYVLQDSAGGTSQHVGAINVDDMPGAYYGAEGISEILVVPGVADGRFQLELIGLGDGFRGGANLLATSPSGITTSSVPFSGALAAGDNLIVEIDFGLRPPGPSAFANTFIGPFNSPRAQTASFLPLQSIYLAASTVLPLFGNSLSGFDRERDLGGGGSKERERVAEWFELLEEILSTFDGLWELIPFDEILPGFQRRWRRQDERGQADESADNPATEPNEDHRRQTSIPPSTRSPEVQPPPADEPARNASAAAGPAADAAERVDRVQSASPAEDRAASVEDAITDARAIAGAAFSGFICWFPREPRRRRPATPSRHRQP